MPFGSPRPEVRILATDLRVGDVFRSSFERTYTLTIQSVEHFTLEGYEWVRYTSRDSIQTWPGQLPADTSIVVERA